MSGEQKDAKRCVGFGEREGVCRNDAGGPPHDNPIWCGECDVIRRAYLDGQFTKIEGGVRPTQEERSDHHPPRPPHPAPDLDQPQPHVGEPGQSHPA
jgi:hypothetical protein